MSACIHSYFQIYTDFFSETILKTFKYQISRLVSALALMVTGAGAYALDTSANIELDSTYRSGSFVAATDRGLSQSGRVELNVTSKTGTNAFVAGKAAFLAKKDSSVVTDDMWIQLGNPTGNVKLGRFEAIELFALPGDTLVNNAGNLYKAGALRGRKSGSDFHAAGTLNLADGFTAELGLVQTKSGPTKGIRPAVSYASGPLTLRAGFEAGKYVVSGNKVSGLGLVAGYDFGGFKLTGSLANGKTDSSTGLKQNAFALVATLGAANLGYINANTDFGTKSKEKVSTFYASYKMPLFDIKGASITPALSLSKASNAAGITGASPKETAFRIRLNYEF